MDTNAIVNLYSLNFTSSEFFIIWTGAGLKLNLFSVYRIEDLPSKLIVKRKFRLKIETVSKSVSSSGAGSALCL